jgi:hypothetical protein
VDDAVTSMETLRVDVSGRLLALEGGFMFSLRSVGIAVWLAGRSRRDEIVKLGA